MDNWDEPAADAAVAGLARAEEPVIISSGVTVSLPAEGLGNLVLRKGPLLLPIRKAGAEVARLSIQDFVKFIPGTLLGGTLRSVTGKSGAPVSRSRT